MLVVLASLARRAMAIRFRGGCLLPPEQLQSKRLSRRSPSKTDAIHVAASIDTQTQGFP